MYRILLNIIFIAGVSSLLSACIKTLDEKDMPKIESKLVIGGYISPQDTIVKIFVGKSVPIYQKSKGFNANPVKDATVLLSGNGVSTSLLYDEKLSSYTIPASQYPIIPGATYHLIVSTPEGYYAEAETIVPKDINSSLKFSLDTIERSINYTYSGKSLQISVWWDDIQNQNNYYRIYGEAGTIYDSTYYSPKYKHYNEIYFDTKNIAIKDIGYENGKIGPFKTDTPLENMNRRLSDIGLTLLNTDRNYYEFYKSYDSNYQENFFSEPQNIYTNIKGGLGVFASYQKYTVKITLK
ncbi:hypothetical protein MYP_3273 [Sporocytophaga myxococcoides]|uniref:DUF4249 domain-containing protein n=1 Tax=Sporocytophaga myxococcoides TaxID=153721 RepID=A0A098LHX1_9BACT|nr:DUF4249 domain-containing protein [Sporocytophaga myxococcoides]GAL86044.1 hypothetical protein MYP_3273 [Sporocytophaga myxococcoides]